MASKVLILCNPLLDISADVNDAFLSKYNLKAGNAILAEPIHGEGFFSELAATPGVQYIAGGSAMNTARVCSWILAKPNLVSYLGAVGKDAYGQKLKDNAKADGVDVEGMYDVTDGTPTGLCGVCVVGKERSLVAALNAANKFPMEQMLNPVVQARVEAANIVYVSGFHLTVCFDAVMHLAKHCEEKKKIFSMNMSAPFIMLVFKAQLEQLLPLCDIIFCNEDEAKGLSTMLGWTETEPQAIAKKIISNGLLKKGGRNVVCFTQGKDPTIIESTEGSSVLVPVPPVDASKIVDTNGAGDAFVGGFLSQLAQGESLARCAAVGNYAAGVVIQHSGCQYPATANLPPK
eukprot:PhF_6_TR12902/c0_g1_i1/m.20324/K00856/E2.7.1.20, ADK; adenosine kinase